MPTSLKITDKLREKDRRESDDRRRLGFRVRGSNSYLVNLGYNALILVAVFVLWDLDITVASMVWAAAILVLVVAVTWLYRCIADR